MIYDVIIIGGGPAGASSAIAIQTSNKRCLILERKKRIDEKTCGGFLSAGGVQALCSIGLNVHELFEMGADRINSFVYIRNDETKVIPYNSNSYGIGCTRKIFDNWLLNHACRLGTEIQFSTYVKNISHEDGLFRVNGYLTSNVIIASGTSGLMSQNQHDFLNNCSFGLSAQITGLTNLSKNNIYFYIIGANGLDYFWIIPNGNNIWNIGIWFKRVPVNAVSLFWKYKEKYVDALFKNTIFVRKLKGAYCGNVPVFNDSLPGLYVIGDAGGFNNSSTGAGLRAAITSAIDVSKIITK